MRTRHGYRFLAEALYLAGLAAALAFSTVGVWAIVGAMAVGWLLVVGIEWASFRSLPHFAAGEPPQWHVPRVLLPPPRPLEQLTPAYPEAQRDEAVTWIAPAELREELLGGWPVATVAEDTQEAPPPEPWIEPEGVPEPEAEPERVEPVSARSAETRSEPEPEPVETVSSGTVETVSDVSAQRLARYHPDPLAEPERRRFRRRGPEPAFIEVPARPAGPRALPGAARRAAEER